MNKMSMLTILVTVTFLSFSVGYGLASRNLPLFLIDQAQEKVNLSAQYFADGNNETGRYYLFSALDNCYLYRYMYRTENVFDINRDNGLYICDEIDIIARTLLRQDTLRKYGLIDSNTTINLTELWTH